MKAILHALAFSMLATAGMAHSPLDSTTPAADAVLLAMPEVLEMTFNRPIRLTSVELSLANGSPAKVETPKAFAPDFTLPLTLTAPGTYEVFWRGLGDDGHAQKGRFVFMVE